MSKGRFPNHSQHPLTACVPCTVKLCCWDTPPTTGGNAITVQGPRGAHTGNTLSCKEEESYTHTCNWSDVFWVCWHWAHVTTDDFICDDSREVSEFEHGLK